MSHCISLIVFFAVVTTLTGCADQQIKHEEQYAQNVQATREWLRGPMMSTCGLLPGPESRKGCSVTLQRMLASLRGEVLTRDDHFRIELAKAKGVDETVRLWSPQQQEAWLRGPRTAACGRAPFPDQSRQCLNGVESDLDLMGTPRETPMDPAEIRAERAVARIEARDRQRATEQQRAHEMDLVRQEAAGRALMGFGMGGGLFKSAPPMPASQPTPAPAFTPTQTAPISCTSQQMGQMVQTNCY